MKCSLNAMDAINFGYKKATGIQCFSSGNSIGTTSFTLLPNSQKMKFLFALAILVIALTAVYGQNDPWKVFKVGISSAHDGGFGTASGTGTANLNTLTGEAGATGTGDGSHDKLPQGPPGGFGQPGFGSAGHGGVPASDVRISSAQNGGIGTGSGTGTVTKKKSNAGGAGNGAVQNGQATKIVYRTSEDVIDKYPGRGSYGGYGGYGNHVGSYYGGRPSSGYSAYNQSNQQGYGGLTYHGYEHGYGAIGQGSGSSVGKKKA